MRELYRWSFWLLKLSASLIGTSFCLGMQAILFFALQETWKLWAAGEIEQRQLVIFTVTLVLYHSPFLAGSLWFSRQVQRLWDNPHKGEGG